MLGGADAIVLHRRRRRARARLREDALAGLAELGVEVDEERNRRVEGPTVVSPDSSRTAVLVVPTDEELAIARQVADLLR